MLAPVVTTVRCFLFCFAGDWTYEPEVVLALYQSSGVPIQEGRLDIGGLLLLLLLLLFIADSILLLASLPC